MAVDLNQKAINAHAPMLQQMMTNLQGNILKSHGREYTRHVFFSFGADVKKNKQLIKSLIPFLTSSAKQFKSKKRVFTDAERKSVFGNFFLRCMIERRTGLVPLKLAFPPSNCLFNPADITMSGSAPISRL